MSKNKLRHIFNYEKLRRKIIIECGSFQKFAEKMNMNVATLCKKLNGVTYFTTSEIYDAIEILNILRNEIPEYFFEQ